MSQPWPAWQGAPLPGPLRCWATARRSSIAPPARYRGYRQWRSWWSAVPARFLPETRRCTAGPFPRPVPLFPVKRPVLEDGSCKSSHCCPVPQKPLHILCPICVVLGPARILSVANQWRQRRFWSCDSPNAYWRANFDSCFLELREGETRPLPVGAVFPSFGFLRYRNCRAVQSRRRVMGLCISCFRILHPVGNLNFRTTNCNRVFDFFYDFCL